MIFRYILVVKTIIILEMSKTQNLRPLKSIPVYIEEDHHEVLPHIFKHIGKIGLRHFN